METNNKLREALKYLRDASREFHHLILNSKYNEICDKYKYAEVAKIRDAIATANATLAAPPRNCDIGTASDMAQRFKQFCQEHCSLYKCCDDCPLKHRGAPCEFEWTQMRYEKGEIDEQ